ASGNTTSARRPIERTRAAGRREASIRANEGSSASPICSLTWIAGTSARLYARLYMPVGPGPKNRETRRLSQRRDAKAQRAPADIGTPNANRSRVARIENR